MMTTDTRDIDVQSVAIKERVVGRIDQILSNTSEEFIFSNVQPAEQLVVVNTTSAVSHSEVRINLLD